MLSIRQGQARRALQLVGALLHDTGGDRPALGIGGIKRCAAPVLIDGGKAILRAQQLNDRYLALPIEPDDAIRKCAADKAERGATCGGRAGVTLHQ